MFAPRQLKVKPKLSTATEQATSTPPSFASDLGSTTTRPEPPTSTSSSKNRTDYASKHDDKSIQKDRHRLEALLTILESCFSDWSLSTYGKTNGLLDLLRKDSDQDVHLQHVIRLQPIRAITESQYDLQRALQLRPSLLIGLSPKDPFSMHRIPKIDYERLETLSAAYWDDCVIYLENIPSPQLHSLSLITVLNRVLRTEVQRVVLPHAYDPSNPPSERHDDPTDQSLAFAQSQSQLRGKGKGKESETGLVLPKGGGDYKGFAFVILKSREDTERIFKEYKWEQEARVDGVKDERSTEGPTEDGEVDELIRLANKMRMRCCSYVKWLELKAEYLSYQRVLLRLKQADLAAENNNDVATSFGEHSRTRQIPTTPGIRIHPPHFTGSVMPHNSQSNPRIASTLQPRSGPQLDTTAPLEVRGAYPVGCVAWVRNVHEKSTKGNLRTLFGKLLDRLEEGSGKGAEYVEYEKGLETCYVRFSTPHHALLILKHFETNATIHLTPTYFSFENDPQTPPEELDVLALQKDGRRQVMVELLKGEKERDYWAAIPETKRKEARKKGEGVIIGVAGKKRKNKPLETAETEALSRISNGAETEDKVSNDVEKKRKRANVL